MVHYGDNIIFSYKFGSNTIICFTNKHYEILSDKRYKQKSKDEEEEKFMLKAVGEILRRPICSQVYDNNIYTVGNKLFDNVQKSIPKFLKFFIQK